MTGRPPSPKPNKRAKQPQKKSVSPQKEVSPPSLPEQRELVILTGLSGSGKASALKTLEDMGFYSVDNMPLELLSQFADLVGQSPKINRAALVVDVREGQTLEHFPSILKKVRRTLPTTVIYLEASDPALLRRYSETRRPHPLGRADMVVKAIEEERRRLDPIRNVADIIVDTSQFNVHELRAYIQNRWAVGKTSSKSMLISLLSFGYKNGVPLDADLVFDVRFLPNPHFVPEFRPLTGKHRKVIEFVRNFPQTQEFLDRVTDLLLFLLPHYIHEGKSYLTVAFGCTGGQHRSVMIAEEVRKRLAKQGYEAKTAHRDMPR